jgi:hypothetical protein
VSDPQLLARQYGVAIELADLGDWGDALLVSEYDPAGPVIRINERAIERYRTTRGALSSCDVRALIDFATAHELYHHREAIGEVARVASGAEREAAADAFARATIAPDADRDAFLNAVRRR